MTHDPRDPNRIENIPAGQLGYADQGRRYTYQFKGAEFEGRIATLKRLEMGTTYVELRTGDYVLPPLKVTLEEDDRFTPDTATGWHRGMSDADYHADPLRHLAPAGSFSSSMAKAIVKPAGPAKLRHQLDSPRVEKRAFDLGHAAHTLALGAGLEIELLPFKDLRTKAAQAKEAEIRRAGKVPLRPDDYETVHRMADALRGHAQAAELIDAAEREVSGFVRHDSGLWLRVRADLKGDGYLADLKTATSADPQTFRNDAAKFGYHIQDGFYSSVARMIDGGDPPKFLFIVQEKTAPYLVSVVDLSEEYRAIGTAEVEYAITLWNEAVESGYWPGYNPGITTVDPPTWLRARAAQTGAYTETLDTDIEATILNMLEGN